MPPIASVSEQCSPLARIGCAGWSLSSKVSDRFPQSGTHLERYAQVFADVARRMQLTLQDAADAWCILDNTAAGEAIPNALSLKRMMEGPSIKATE